MGRCMLVAIIGGFCKHAQSTTAGLGNSQRRASLTRECKAAEGKRRGSRGKLVDVRSEKFIQKDGDVDRRPRTFCLENRIDHGRARRP